MPRSCSREGERNAFDDERPQHAFRLENPLGVACHPVTNAEYALFMRAGGYNDERWWPEGEAREWWKGERPDTLTQDWVDQVQDWSESFFQELLETWGWDKSNIEARKTIREKVNGMWGRKLTSVHSEGVLNIFGHGVN